MSSLSQRIQEQINAVQRLKTQYPGDTALEDQYWDLKDLLEKAQAHEVSEANEEYQNAIEQLNAARNEAESALASINQVASTINKTASAINALNRLLSVI